MHYHMLIFLFLFSGLHGKTNVVEVYGSVGKNHTCSKGVSDLLETANRNYPSIRASRQMMLGANAQMQSAKWNYFPTPSVDISQRAGRSGTTLRLDQPLWTGGKLDALSDLAAARQDEAHYTLGESSYALAGKFLMVLQSYIQADGQIKGFDEGKRQLESFTQMLDKRIDAGVSSESDRELLNSRIAQINADLITAQARYEMSKSQLELLMGRPLKCAIGFKKDRTIKQNMSLEQMKEALRRTHVTLKKLKAQIGMSQAEKKSADAVLMPNVSLRAEYQRGSVYTDDTSSDTLGYVAVSFSPGAGLSSMSNIESAKYRVLQAQDELVTKEFELMDILLSDYADYHAAKNRVPSIEKTIESSQKVLESYTRLFIAGKRQWLDLVNTSREVTQNQIALATLKAVLIASSYRLALETGRIDFEAEGSR